jgi:2-keto-4-pentenoate hydratase/2-oxohepta-3-ene-1,7-dioic acid hydratase in catechol pathway
VSAYARTARGGADQIIEDSKEKIEEGEEEMKRMEEEHQRVIHAHAAEGEENEERVDQIIKDLKEKIEEGEEEMKRMREEHQRVIFQMEQAHAAELKEKEEAELENIFTKHARERLTDREEQIVTLRDELDEDTSLTYGSEDYHHDMSFGNEEEEDESNEIASTPGLKRLPRRSCSE